MAGVAFKPVSTDARCVCPVAAAVRNTRNSSVWHTGKHKRNSKAASTCENHGKFPRFYDTMLLLWCTLRSSVPNNRGIGRTIISILSLGVMIVYSCICFFLEAGTCETKISIEERTLTLGCGCTIFNSFYDNWCVVGTFSFFKQADEHPVFFSPAVPRALLQSVTLQRPPTPSLKVLRPRRPRSSRGAYNCTTSMGDLAFENTCGSVVFVSSWVHSAHTRYGGQTRGDIGRGIKPHWYLSSNRNA